MVNYVNDPYASNSARYPHARVLIGNNTVYPISFDVTTKNNLTANTFKVEFSLYDQAVYNTNWWSTQTAPLMVVIQAGFSQNGNIDYQTIVSGQIDDMDINISGGTVSANGRDLASNFIDTKLTMSFQNEFSSTAVTALAAGHGMQANVVATNTPIGRYYQTDHTNTNDGENAPRTTEWDFMCWLARLENYDLFVTGNTINFLPTVNSTAPLWGIIAPEMGDPSNGVSVWYGDSNVNNLRLERSMTLAKDIKVVVQGWHSQNGAAFKATAQRGKGTNPSTGVQTYVYNAHNITQQNAQILANNYLSDLSKHELKISWAEPGDYRLTAQTMVQLMDTNSAWDTNYFIDTISFHFDIGAGLEMTATAKNHSPQNETTV